MAWSAPRTWVANAVLTAAQLNVDIRDNMNETPAAKATTAGRWFIATGANSIAERSIETAELATAETTTSTSYTDLTTSGPAVTATTGTKAIVIIGCESRNNTVGQSSFMSYAVSSASTIAATDTHALVNEAAVANTSMQYSNVVVETGLTAGSNVFTAKYRVDGGTGSFSRRLIIVMAL